MFKSHKITHKTIAICMLILLNLNLYNSNVMAAGSDISEKRQLSFQEKVANAVVDAIVQNVIKIAVQPIGIIFDVVIWEKGAKPLYKNFLQTSRLANTARKVHDKNLRLDDLVLSNDKK